MKNYGQPLAATLFTLLNVASAAADPTPSATPTPRTALAIAYPNPALPGETVTLEARHRLGVAVSYGWHQVHLADEPSIGLPIASLRVVTLAAPTVSETTPFRVEVSLTALPIGPELDRATADFIVRPEIGEGATISGRVAAVEPCEGSVDGRIVVLSPIGWTALSANIDGQPGRFAFRGVPPGNYQVEIFGEGDLPCSTCYPPVAAEGSADVDVDLCPVQATPTATIAPSSPSPTPTRTPSATITPTITKTATATQTSTPCGASALQTLAVDDPPHADCATFEHKRRYRVPVEADGRYIAVIHGTSLVSATVAERENGAARTVLNPNAFGLAGSSTGELFLTIAPVGSGQVDFDVDIQPADKDPIVPDLPAEIDLGADELSNIGAGDAGISNEGPPGSALRLNGFRIRLSNPDLASCFATVISSGCTSTSPCVLLSGESALTTFDFVRNRTTCSFQRGSGPTAEMVIDLEPQEDRVIPIYGETLPYGCAGDCGDDGAVDGSDIRQGVNQVLAGHARFCPTYDRDRDFRVTVDEVTSAIVASLGSCHP